MFPQPTCMHHHTLKISNCQQTWRKIKPKKNMREGFSPFCPHSRVLFCLKCDSHMCIFQCSLNTLNPALLVNNVCVFTQAWATKVKICRCHERRVRRKDRGARMPNHTQDSEGLGGSRWIFKPKLSVKGVCPTPARFSHWLRKLGLNHKSSGGAAGPSAGVVSQVHPLGQETRVTCVHRCQAIHSVLSLGHRCLSECLSCFAKFLSSPRPCTL